MLFNKKMVRRQRRSDLSPVLTSVVELLERRRLLSATPVGSETLVNTTTTGTQAVGASGGRSVAVAPDNSYVTVWTSSLGDGSGYGIYARRFAADGTAVSGEIRLNSTAVNDQTEPAVAIAASGRFVVAWQSQNQDGSGPTIVVKQFSASGTPLTTEMIANTTTAGSQQSPAVAYLSGGGFVVTWSGQGAGDTSGIFARVSNAAGSALVGSEILVNETTSASQSRPSVAADGTGGFAVAWQGNGLGDSAGIFFRDFNQIGGALTPETRVNQTVTGVQQYPSIATLSDGSFVVAWSGNGVGEISGVFVRQISALGTVLGSEILVNQSTSGTQQTPSVTASGTGFAVAWQGAGASDSSGIYLREFDFRGLPIAGESRVNTTVADTQRNPTVAAMNGGLVIDWSGTGTGDAAGVFLQRYTNFQFIVNSFADTVDVNPGDGIAADANGKVSLRAAIMEANALHYPVPVVITLMPGTYNLSLAGNVEDAGATGDLDILSKVEIVGAGAAVTTVSGNSLDRVFHVLPGSSLSLRSLKVTGGNATYSGSPGGGGVLSDHASLLITDSVISGNQGISDDEDFGGGGVGVLGGAALIRNTTFTGNISHRLTPRDPNDHSNDSTAYGGGLYANGARVDVFGGLFTNNSGHEGGAIASVSGSVMTITGTILRGNSTDYTGGAIQNEFSKLGIQASILSNNQAPRSGGGLFSFAGVVTITATNLTGNTTAGSGGAIVNSGRVTAAIGTMTVTKSNLSGNSAMDGGAIANFRDSVLTIVDTTISRNAATEAGGGVVNNNIDNYSPGTVTMLRTILANNTAVYGGGVYALNSKTNITDSTVVNNVAHSGGGLSNIDGATMRVVHTSVTGNSTDHEGGGIQNELASLTVINSSLTNNHATDDGGALFNFAGTVGISGSTFTGNSAGSEGGAIENTGRVTAAIGTMTIRNTTISGNSADTGGGVDNKRDSVMTITDSRVIGNSAVTAGGGISNQNIEIYEPGHLTLLRVTVNNNTSQLYGGGLYAAKNSTEITDSRFTGNTANEGGAIDNVDGGVMTVVHSTFNGNSSNREGGAIQNELSSLTLTNSTFTNNGVGFDGGAIFNFAGVVQIDGSTFSGNAAGRQGGAIENTGRITAAIGTMTITNSTIRDNTAATGGGLDNRRDSVMTVTDSRVTGNFARTGGGGIANQNTESFGPGTLTILRTSIDNNLSVNGGGILTVKNTTKVVNSTISGNSASLNSGGGIMNTSGGTTSLVNATIAYNAADHGGGVYSDSGTVNVANSIVAKNTATTDNPDVGGTFISGGHALIGIVGAALGFTNGVNGDVVGTVGSPVDPLLGALQSNGGPTPTIALLVGSLAINRGDNSVAAAAGLTTDQRGLNRLVNGIVDIGAYEFGA